MLGWSQVGGSGTGTVANPKVAGSTATFGLAGIYVLRLMANDGALSSSDSMTVIAVVSVVENDTKRLSPLV